MKQDSEEWRQKRNQLLQEWICDAAAIRFVLDVFEVCEVWDDLVDKDKPICNERINRAFATALIEINANPFYQRFYANISPVLLIGLNQWLDANKLDKGSKSDRALAYVLRGWYCELVSEAIYLLHGWDRLRDVSMEIKRLFFLYEDLEDFMAEVDKLEEGQ